MKILIDNGHGKDTPGKRSPNGLLLEYSKVREIAKAVVETLVSQGYDALLIVPEDWDVSLSTRCKRVNAICDKYGSGNVLLVSIHLNAAGNGRKWMDGRGWEVYTSRGETKADKLADCLCEAALANLPGMKIREDLSDGDRDKERDFYILKNTKCAAALTENLFMDNLRDYAFLTSQEGVDRIVNLHVDGIINYIQRK